MKNRIRRGVTLLLIVAILLGQTLSVNAVTMITTQEESLKIAVLSDTHYLSPTMIKDTDDFATHLNSDRKMFAESDAFLTGLLETVKADQPEVLLISGDLTKDGEKEGHEEVAAKLEEFRDENLPDLKIYVTPGNHDVNNSNAMNFNTPDGVAAPAGRTSQEDFKDIYGELTYNDESISATFTPGEGKQGGGLSYAARPNPGFTIISIDTVRYSADNTDSGTGEQETGGIMSSELEQWVVDQTKAARERGDTVIGLQHHGLIPHFSQEPTILADYLVKDYERISTEFANAGMGYVFTGHMHANDIAGITTAEGNSLYDIETGSIVTYPSPARSVTINRTISGGEVTENMGVKTHLNVGPVSFTNPVTKEHQTINDITAYGQEHGFTDPMLSTTLNGFLDEYLASAYETGSKEAIMELVNGLLGDSLPGGGNLSMEKLVDVGLPLLLPDGSNGETVYYDSSQGGILASVPIMGSTTMDVLISNKGIKDTLNALTEKIDNEVLNDSEKINRIVEDLVPKLTAIPLTEDGHTLLDYANYIYQSHLGGEEAAPMPAWVEEATESVENGDTLNRVLDVAVAEIDDVLNDVLSNVTFEELTGIGGYKTADRQFVPSEEGRTPLFQPVHESAAMLGLAITMVFGWKTNGAGVFVSPAGTVNPELGYTVKDFTNVVADKLGIDVNQMLIGLIMGTPADEEAGTPATEGLLTNDLKKQLNDMVLGIVTSMGTDENYRADNNTDITNSWKLLTDRTALEEAFTTAAAIDLSKYTDESAKVLADALEAASTLPLTATQEEMDQTAQTINNAVAALVLKPVSAPVPTPTDDDGAVLGEEENPGDSGGDNGEDGSGGSGSGGTVLGEAARTNDSMNVALGLLILLLSLAGLAVLIITGLKNKRNHSA